MDKKFKKFSKKWIFDENFQEKPYCKADVVFPHIGCLAFFA